MNRYQKIIAHVFEKNFSAQEKQMEIPFTRDHLVEAANFLKLRPPKNLGDIIYSFRYRNPMPSVVLEAQPDGLEWVIVGKGRAKYAFKLIPYHRILPNPQYLPIKIPDATPEIVLSQALSDEQALLAKLRYNRLIDLFLGITGY